MESWSRNNNALIKSIDSQAQPPIENRVLKNTLKTLIPVPISQELGGNSIYGRRFRFDLPRQYDNLSQLYIKAEITVASHTAEFSVQPYLATRLFDEVSLRTKGSNNIIQMIRPEYSYLRIDERVGTPIYSRYEQAVNAPLSFYQAKSPAAISTATVFLPLDFFFSENTTTFLNSRNIEELCLFVRTNQDAYSMGMSVDLASANYTLYCLYQDTDGSSLKAELKNSVKLGMPRTIKGSYNIFEEETKSIVIGQTSQKLLLRCPYPAFALHTCLTDIFKNRLTINRMTLTLNGVKFLDLDYRINFQNYAQFNKAFVESETFSYWVSINKDRSVDSGLITASIGDNMSPFFMEVFFDATDRVYDLTTFWEYRTDYSIGDTGTIGFSDGASRLGFPNSTGFNA